MWFGVLGAIGGSAQTSLLLSSRRQRALLGMLVCHRGHAVSVDRLVEAIWEDDSEPLRGKAALQSVASRLRTALSAAGGDPRVIISDEAGHRLAADATQIDASVFEALIGEGAACFSGGASDLAADVLERAVSLFRSAPYEEFAHCSWARAEATRLSERYADANGAPRDSASRSRRPPRDRPTTGGDDSCVPRHGCRHRHTRVRPVLGRLQRGRRTVVTFHSAAPIFTASARRDVIAIALARVDEMVK